MADPEAEPNERNVRTGDPAEPPAGGVLRLLTEAIAAAGRARGFQDAAWLELVEVLAERYRDRRLPVDVDGNLDRIGAVFGLSENELDLLAVIAAPDLDPAFALAAGRLRGHQEVRPMTVALALELAGIGLLSGHGRALVSAAGALRRWGLVTAGRAELALEATLSAAESTIGTLLGHRIGDPLADQLAVRIEVPGQLADTPPVRALAAALAAGFGLAWVEETAVTAGPQTAAAAYDRAGLVWHAYDLGRLPAQAVGDSGRLPVEAALLPTVTALVREAGLGAGGLVLVGGHRLRGAAEVDQVMAHLAAAPIPVVLVGHGRWDPRWWPELPVVVRAATLDVAARLDWWRRHLPDGMEPADLVSGYRLRPEQIAAAGRHFARRAGWDPAGGGQPAALVESVRLLAGAGRISSGAVARVGFDDLELPPEPKAELMRLADWVRVREQVAARGPVHGLAGKANGLTALFTGGPGTGKTLAAHVIADAVGLDLMQVDLSAMIDKYIGETEKNLERVFTEAENLNVVLFFDEADALFGSRSEVKDARDRYANQEVSYLLQRMEHFGGITVLASNLRGNIDAAFSRRMNFVISFPDPDADTRRRLWAGLLRNVGELDPDDPPNVDALAEVIELAGGDLRNIALGAAYDATVAGCGVGHRHLVTAAIREFSKLGRRVPPNI